MWKVCALYDFSPCLICLVDALRSDAVGKLIKASGIPVQSRATIIPPFSFKPDAAFLTGLYPEQTDSFGEQLICPCEKKSDAGQKKYLPQRQLPAYTCLW